MSKRIFIDARHPEEVRAVLCENKKIVEFDFDNSISTSMKGNIYLARVVRVEPSLQAVFVEYEKDMNAFLPFCEIHPDYYQIPKEDRDALLDEIISGNSGSNREDDEESGSEILSAPVGNEALEQEGSSAGASADLEEEGSEAGAEDKSEAVPQAKEEGSLLNKYSVHEVIKKGQIILVQIEKEARGNKCVAVTTYITLAGRCCVLLPNAMRAGGISRKIANKAERVRLQQIVSEVSEHDNISASIIVRTSGMGKDKAFIRGDILYLVQLWNAIREQTLSGTAPAFIYDESDIYKHIIRDLYDTNVREVLVDGSIAYNKILHFIDLIGSKDGSKIKLYDQSMPIMHKYGIEQQIAELYSSTVQLPSGGYLVIDHTEALVAIDVNSGKHMSNRNIEDTAFQANIEAVHEIGLQMRLRNLSGLIVIDFIDMVRLKNKKAVEAAARSVFSKDRARIQFSRISAFGLMEISRQRVAQNFVEGNTHKCIQCDGRGYKRPVITTLLAILRAVESEIKKGIAGIDIQASEEIITALYNQKRSKVTDLEGKYDITISCFIDHSMNSETFTLSICKKKQSSAHGKHDAAVSEDSIDTSAVKQAIEEEILIDKAASSDQDDLSAAPQKRRRYKRTKKASPNQIEEDTADKDINDGEVVRERIGDGEVDQNKKKVTRNKKKRPKRNTRDDGDDSSDGDDSDDDASPPSNKSSSFLRQIWRKVIE